MLREVLALGMRAVDTDTNTDSNTVPQNARTRETIVLLLFFTVSLLLLL